MKRRIHGGPAFTLIELMITMVVVTTLIGIGAYTYIAQLRQIKIKSDSREVSQYLQLARMRTLSTGRGHGLAFNTSSGEYMVYVDCNRDNTFTDGDSSLGNNSAVGTVEGCTSTLTYDPRVEGQPIKHLEQGNSFDSILGTSFNYISFNSLGQAMQNNALASGDIVVRNANDDDGVHDQILIHVNSSGMSNVRPVQRVR